MSVFDHLTDEISQPATRPAADFYSQSFYRNIGIFSRIEQERLRNACVAIPGMGGIGSAALIALTRMGVGKFRIADYSDYSVVNINRQYGATPETIGKQKTEVMAALAKKINPEVQITIFNAPITDSNIDHFLSGSNIIIDGLDFFLPDTRCLLYRKAREKGLYALLATNLGFSATLQVFSPTGMPFAEYFNFDSAMNFENKMAAFINGVAPKGLHKKYMDDGKIDFVRKRLPSMGTACEMAANMAATATANILLQRQSVKAAPYFSQFDAYRMKHKAGYLWLGNRNPLQRIKILLTKFSQRKAERRTISELMNDIRKKPVLNG